MKQAARKTPQLSIVPSQQEANGPDSAESLNEFFSGWLDSVAPELSQKTPAPVRGRARGLHKYPVSSTDIVRVNRATVRESSAHRHWPPDVVAQFLAAEVIRTRSKST